MLSQGVNYQRTERIRTACSSVEASLKAAVRTFVRVSNIKSCCSDDRAVDDSFAIGLTVKITAFAKTFNENTFSHAGPASWSKLSEHTRVESVRTSEHFLRRLTPYTI